MKDNPENPYKLFLFQWAEFLPYVKEFIPGKNGVSF